MPENYRTACPVDGCEWVCSYPPEAKLGADYALADHLAVVHVTVGAQFRSPVHAPTPDVPETGVSVER